MLSGFANPLYHHSALNQFYLCVVFNFYYIKEGLITRRTRFQGWIVLHTVTQRRPTSGFIALFAGILFSYFCSSSLIREKAPWKKKNKNTNDSVNYLSLLISSKKVCFYTISVPLKLLSSSSRDAHPRPQEPSLQCHAVSSAEGGAGQDKEKAAGQRCPLHLGDRGGQVHAEILPHWLLAVLREAQWRLVSGTDFDQGSNNWGISVPE